MSIVCRVIDDLTGIRLKDRFIGIKNSQGRLGLRHLPTNLIHEIPVPCILAFLNPRRHPFWYTDAENARETKSNGPSEQALVREGPECG